MELTLKEDKSTLVLHLVNFDTEYTPVKNIKIDVQIPEGKKVKQVTVMTPDGRGDDNIQYRENGGRALFTVPQLSIYDLVVLKME